MYRTLQAKTFAAIVLLASFAAIGPAGATTFVPSQTIKAGTRIACVLDETISSQTATSGTDFKLKVVDTAHPALEGSEIHGWVTDVRQPSGAQRARIGFWLTSIHLPNGKKKSISATVVSRRVVPMNNAAQHQQRQQLAPTMTIGMVTPGPIAWQMRVGGGSSTPTVSNRPSGLLGGYIYGQSANEQIVIPSGQPVTIELQADLTIP
ncbi:MAG: hypothetical protein WA814_04175 [Candidatus Baltobacteraceae bacterium]